MIKIGVSGCMFFWYQLTQVVPDMQGSHKTVVCVHFFWYRLTRVVPDKFHRAVKWLCVCVCVCVCIMRGRLYNGCVKSSMFHGSKTTWPVRKENKKA